MNSSTAEDLPRSALLRSGWTGYAFAGVAVAVATLVRLALDPLFGGTFPFFTYVMAVAVVAGFGRTQTAVLALAGGGLLGVALFAPPRYTLALPDPNALIGLTLYLFVGAVVVVMSHAMRAARLRAEGSLAEAVAGGSEVRRAMQAEAEQRERLRTTLASIGDAVISTDAGGNVTYLNAVAEALTGWANADAAGRPLDAVFRIVNEATREPVESPSVRALRDGVIVGLANHTVLIAKDGSERPIDDSAAPIRASTGEVVGCVLVFRDITQRRRNEQSLRDSEERAAFVRRASGVGFWYCDLPFDVLQWDELVKAHFHLPPDAPVTIDTFYARIHPDDREPTRRAIERSIADRGGYDTVYRTVGPDDGAVKWVRALGRTFYAADGTPTRFDGVTLDMTDQKRAEAALRASEEQYRTLFDTMDEGFCVIEFLDGPHGPLSDYVHVAANPAYTANAGIPDIVGRKVREMVPDEAAAWVEVYRGVLLTGKPVRFERELIATRRHLALSAFRIGPPERRQVAVLFNDISARKRAEQVTAFMAGASAALGELNDSASTFHKVAVLSVPAFADWCAVDMLDDDGRPQRVAVMHADPEKVREFAALLAKYPPRPGDPHGILKVIRTGESELVEDITDAVLASVTHDEDHFRRLRALGLRSHILAPIRSHGRVLGVVTFITAESGRKYTAADLRVAEDLAGRAAVAVENARLYQALQDADRRKDEFLATLAHELRNPLAPIRNAVQVFRLKGADDPDLQRGRDVIDRQVAHLTRLIDDLLDLSRIARNKLELRRGRVTLADAVAGAVETSRPLVEQMGHDLAVELPPDPIYLDADLIRLSQVFMNLLTNAAKYTPAGGHIRLTARREGDEAVVAVRDNGLGIPAEKLPHLFEMFFQVDGTLEKSQGGLGIGLSLVRRLVEMHGGTVAATSPGVNRGSEFTVRLPVLAWQPDPPPAPPPPPNSPTGRLARRILVVDDNRDAADSLAMLLGLTGHQVRTAYDGEAGVTAADAFRPDVILMDIGMPKLNGYDAARRIREQPWGRAVLLVALTGWGHDDDRRRTDEAGFDAHLVKPVDHAALTKLLEETRRP